MDKATIARKQPSIRTAAQAEDRTHEAWLKMYELRHDLEVFSLALSGAIKGLVTHGVTVGEAETYCGALFSQLERFDTVTQSAVESMLELSHFLRQSKGKQSKGNRRHQKKSRP